MGDRRGKRAARREEGRAPEPKRTFPGNGWGMSLPRGEGGREEGGKTEGALAHTHGKMEGALAYASQKLNVNVEIIRTYGMIIMRNFW